MIYNYSLYGVNLQSEIRLPSLREPQSEAVDVVIRLGIVPLNLKNPADQSIRFQVKPKELLLKVDSIATFWVQDGKSITIQTEPNVDKPQPNRNDLTLKQRDASHQASESS